jgi:hypothetical protein
MCGRPKPRRRGSRRKPRGRAVRADHRGWLGFFVYQAPRCHRDETIVLTAHRLDRRRAGGCSNSAAKGDTPFSPCSVPAEAGSLCRRPDDSRIPTFCCSRLTWPVLASRHAGPWPRKISATSSAARTMCAECYAGRAQRCEAIQRAHDRRECGRLTLCPASTGTPSLVADVSAFLSHRTFHQQHHWY